MDDSFFSICIGRQLASGGRAVGRILSERLGASYYDREILFMAARESGLSSDIFEEHDERKGFFGYASRAWSSVFTQGYVFQQPMSDVQLLEFQANAIRHAAEKGNCVFIGRAADYVLRDHPRCLSVFILADEADRIARLRQTMPEATDAELSKMIQHVDSKRADFYNFYSGKAWGEATNYDMCLNVSKLGIEKAADIIIEAIGK